MSSRTFFALLRGRAATLVIAVGVTAGLPLFAFAAPVSQPDGLSITRSAVVDVKDLVSRGDLGAARIRIKDLDAYWDRGAGGSTKEPMGRWRVVDRAIDHALDRALDALEPRSPHAEICNKALADLLAVVNKVDVKHRTRADGERS